MGDVVRIEFDGHRQLDKLDTAVRTLSARLKLAASPFGGLDNPALACPQVAEHLRASAASLRHLADQLTLAAISIEARNLPVPLAKPAG